MEKCGQKVIGVKAKCNDSLVATIDNSNRMINLLNSCIFQNYKGRVIKINLHKQK